MALLYWERIKKIHGMVLAMSNKGALLGRIYKQSIMIGTTISIKEKLEFKQRYAINQNQLLILKLNESYVYQYQYVLDLYR